MAKFGQDRFGWLDSFNGAIAYNYDEAGHLIGEYDGRGNVIEEIVYLGDIPVAVMEGNYFGTGVYYITSDSLGAPHIVTDARNRKVWEWHHAPFGDTEPVSAEGFDLDLRLLGQVVG